MTTPTSTVFFHTQKLFEQGERYEMTFKMMVNALVSDKAKFVVVMSDKEAHCGEITKAEILSAAEGLFKINR
jgi:hypothetical protein